LLWRAVSRTHLHFFRGLVTNACVLVSRRSGETDASNGAKANSALHRFWVAAPLERSGEVRNHFFVLGRFFVCERATEFVIEGTGQ
jgi:hypothetical protein